MRAKAAIIVAVVIGIVLGAYFLIGNRSLGAGQLDKITSACPACHGAVPKYDAAMLVHNKHAAFNCSLCHTDIDGLRVADSIHFDLKWAGAIFAGAIVIAVISNLIMVNRKGGTS